MCVSGCIYSNNTSVCRKKKKTELCINEVMLLKLCGMISGGSYCKRENHYQTILVDRSRSWNFRFEVKEENMKNIHVEAIFFFFSYYKVPKISNHR